MSYEYEREFNSDEEMSSPPSNQESDSGSENSEYKNNPLHMAAMGLLTWKSENAKTPIIQPEPTEKKQIIKFPFMYTYGGMIKSENNPQSSGGNNPKSSDTNQQGEKGKKEETNKKKEDEKKEKHKSHRDLSITSSKIQKINKTNLDIPIFYDLFVQMDLIIRLQAYVGAGIIRDYSDAEVVKFIIETLKSKDEGKLLPLYKYLQERADSFIKIDGEWTILKNKQIIEKRESLIKGLKNCGVIDNPKLNYIKECLELSKNEEGKRIKGNTGFDDEAYKKEVVQDNSLILYEWDLQKSRKENQYSSVKRNLSVNYCIADVRFEIDIEGKKQLIALPIDADIPLYEVPFNLGQAKAYQDKDEVAGLKEIYEEFQKLERPDIKKTFLNEREKWFDSEKALFILINNDILISRLLQELYNKVRVKFTISGITLLIYSLNEPCQSCAILMSLPWKGVIDKIKKKVNIHINITANEIKKQYAYSLPYKQQEYEEILPTDQTGNLTIHKEEIHWLNPGLYLHLPNFFFRKRTVFASKFISEEMPAVDNLLFKRRAAYIEKFNREMTYPFEQEINMEEVYTNCKSIQEYTNSFVEKAIALYNSEPVIFTINDDEINQLRKINCSFIVLVTDGQLYNKKIKYGGDLVLEGHIFNATIAKHEVYNLSKDRNLDVAFYFAIIFCYLNYLKEEEFNTDETKIKINKFVSKDLRRLFNKSAQEIYDLYKKESIMEIPNLPKPNLFVGKFNGTKFFIGDKVYDIQDHNSNQKFPGGEKYVLFFMNMANKKKILRNKKDGEPAYLKMLEDFNGACDIGGKCEIAYKIIDNNDLVKYAEKFEYVNNQLTYDNQMISTSKGERLELEA
jgi:hypothetical protein